MNCASRRFRHRQAAISSLEMHPGPTVPGPRLSGSGRLPARSRVPRQATEAVIYRPWRSATQSGMRGTRGWVLEFEPTKRPRPDFLMGWSGEGDIDSQVRLRFPSREDAERFARAQGLQATVIERALPRSRPKSYAANLLVQPLTL